MIITPKSERKRIRKVVFALRSFLLLEDSCSEANGITRFLILFALMKRVVYMMSGIKLPNIMLNVTDIAFQISHVCGLVQPLLAQQYQVTRLKLEQFKLVRAKT